MIVKKYVQYVDMTIWTKVHLLNMDIPHMKSALVVGMNLDITTNLKDFHMQTIGKNGLPVVSTGGIKMKNQITGTG